MGRAVIRNKPTTLEAIRNIRQFHPYSFTAADAIKRCPNTPQGTVTAIISQLKQAGLIAVSSVAFEGGFVYVITPDWWGLNVALAVEHAAESINRLAGARWEKGGKRSPRRPDFHDDATSLPMV